MFRRVRNRLRWIRFVDLTYWGKSLLLAVVIGGLAGLLQALGFAPKVMVEVLEQAQGALAVVIRNVNESWGADRIVPDWATFGLLVGVAGLMVLRPMMPILWPGYPEILTPLKTPKDVGEDHPQYPGRPLVGRDEDKRGLRMFAGRSSGEHPRWIVISGPMGIGKTKLALEWMTELQAQGWDVGILSLAHSAKDIADARFRRETAILIDDANKADLRDRLEALLDHNERLRVLLTSQVDIPEFVSREIAADARLKERRWPTRRLDPLSDAELAKIAPDRSEEEVARADGRPLMVLLGSDPEKTIRARARDLMPAGSPDGNRYLAFASLAAPVDNKALRASLQSVPGLSERVVLHQGHERKEVKEFVPALSPEPLADTLLSLWFEEASQSEFEELISAACNANPDAVEARLFSLGRDMLGSSDVEAVRKSLHSIFYGRYPDRLQAHRDRAGAIVELSADNVTGTESKEFPALELEQLWGLASALPEEADIQLYLAMGAVNAINLYGEARKFDPMEVWGDRLVGLASLPERSGNANIQLHLVMGAFNAISRYAEARKFDPMEVWGDRLVGLASMPQWSGNANIQLHLAMGAVNAIDNYGEARKFDPMEEWGDRLVGLASMPQWSGNANIQLHLAMGAVNAIKRYGDAGKFASSEEWGDRLVGLASLPDWSGNADIQLHLAMGAVDAISRYGEARKFDPMKEWGDRLVGLTSLPQWSGNADIQLELARGAVNAIGRYGEARKFDPMKGWGDRLAGLASLPQWSENADIQLRLAMGAMNAITAYGEAGDFTSLEVWGDRLIELASRPQWSGNADIQLELARGAVNAIHRYCEAGEFVPVELWGDRLVGLASLPQWSGNADIQLQLAKSSVNAIRRYGRVNDNVSWKNWWHRLRTAVQRAPHSPQIQEIASGFGIGPTTGIE
ncbi:ATP-binding protein [Roseibium polysiphoniae]|uniref:ATP-binding protein n=1 Tax=Roseibium polysiphoniae TaxID=2571221 RepID=A0ABR9CCU1_9HYPH|nr:ATP-binding protein [Roseibium polysiphoniae]MBD8877652.1 ATP-binding protein [Roseibium polysiphoniae]